MKTTEELLEQLLYAADKLNIQGSIETNALENCKRLHKLKTESIVGKLCNLALYYNNQAMKFKEEKEASGVTDQQQRVEDEQVRKENEQLKQENERLKQYVVQANQKIAENQRMMDAYVQSNNINKYKQQKIKQNVSAKMRRERFIQLYEAGYTQEQIMNVLDIAQRTYYLILKEYKEGQIK